MADDIDLPVWTIRPNWKGGILERLSWLTDVLASTYGTEQRRALRLSPRRTFEMQFNPVDQVRTYFDLWLHRLGSDEFMLPLFHDKGKLSEAVVLGEDTIPVDTTYREFEAGGLAIIVGEDPFTFDKLEIISVEADSITVEAPGVVTATGWPKGAAVYPLRRSRLAQESKLTGITSRVGSATLAFELNQANDIPDEGDWDTLYDGLPLLLTKPNWRDTIDLDFIRNTLLLDNDHGLRALNDDAGRAFTLQVHGRMMRGRAEHWSFRQFLYRLRGQQFPIFVPTFNRDMELSQARLGADAYIRVNKVGYGYTGGLVSGRHLLLIGDSTVREVLSVPAAPSATEERLNLTAALGTAMPAGTVVSFVEPCRLSSDDIEIVHHTDTDGVAECNLSFRAFRDERELDEVVDYPIPETLQRILPCGEDLPLIGLSWLLPCLGSIDSTKCSCSANVSDVHDMVGDPDEIYDVSWRVRGVIEALTYTGGTVVGPHTRKNPTGYGNSTTNRYKLVVSDPAAEFYLNAHSVVDANMTLDYEVTIPIRGGATITLHAASMDSVQAKNLGNLSVANDDPDRPIVVAQPYNGQFMQIDMLGVV